MKNFVLDLRNVKSLEESYEVMKKTFDFPSYYVKNLDALNDCLSEMIIEEKVYIIVNRNSFIGFNQIIEVFEDNNIEFEKIVVKP